MRRFINVKGHEGFYQISNLGEVKSFKWGNERILKTQILHGKEKVSLNNYRHFVHDLVAEAFLSYGSYCSGLIVNHINGNKLDNRLENLEISPKSAIEVNNRGKASSKYLGVHWAGHANKWRSQIKLNGKLKHLGLFTCEIEASNAYQKALNNER